jgi:6-phosphogluconolactonase (cycloisomerase 2 family)
MLVPSGLDVFAVDQQTGALQRIPGSPFLGPTGSGPLITSTGTELFTVRSDNTIGAWRLNPQTGVPSVAPGSPFSVGESYVELGAITPDDRMLLVAGNHKIIAMRINDDGSLTSAASTPLSFGAGSFAVEPTARFVYFCGGTDPNDLQGYSLDPSGQLTPLPGTPFDSKACLALNANPSGKYLYAYGGYLTYRIDQSTGALTRISQSVPNYGVAAVLSP